VEAKETTITFRTTEELKKKLQAMADKEQRTLSNMIEILLKKATAKK
jgi:predicted transcriptional regulator